MSKKKKRPSISVTGKIYERLQVLVAETSNSSMSKFVDDAVRSALDDAMILDRLLEKCGVIKEMRQ